MPNGPGGQDYWDTNQMPGAAPSHVNQPGLDQGGLPMRAQQRISEQIHARKPLFTSALSVNELLLTRESGIRPVAQVMGSSIYHIGWQYTPYYTSFELSALTHAYWHARVLALSRMQKEAAMLGAHGVVGVRIESNQYEWGANLIEFQAVGTAVHVPGQPPTPSPFLSNVSGQEFWALCQAGYFPAGYCFGNCTWYEVASWTTMMADAQNAGYAYGYGTSWVNQELTDFTQGVYTARHLAEQRMIEMALRLGADGVLAADVRVDYSPYEADLGGNQHRTDLIVHFHSAGTAVVQVEARDPAGVDYAQFLSD